jgi:hypothetical protein
VADNDFSTGPSEIHLGNVRLLSVVDFAIGALAADTAHNIAEAITNLGAAYGYSATHLLDVVTVVASSTMDEIEFRALHYGTHANFGSFTPSNNLLGGGSPSIGPLVLT